jgi:hypothetical protein
MRKRFLAAGAVAVAIALVVSARGLTAQSTAKPAAKLPGPAGPAAKPSAVKAKAVPRTPWGDPDLQGVWTSDEESGVPFERPSGLGSKEVLEGEELDRALEQRETQRAAAAPLAGGETGAGPTHWYENWGRKSPRTSMVIDPADGRLPAFTDEGQQRQATRAQARARSGRGPSDSWEDRSLYDRCITRGLPAVMFPTIYNNNSRIVQGPGYVAITYEMIHETRLVPLDGRPHVPAGTRFLMGDARGHFEGDTLVVDTTNFTDRTNYRGSGETLHLVERFTRGSDKALRYEVTVNDPHTFVKPWTAALNLTPTSNLYEYGCHEGNYAMKNILSAARSEERQAASTVK